MTSDNDNEIETSAVLVVEDEPLLRMAAAQYLEHSGFSVTQAANASEAIDCLQADDAIGAVFTDIDMPGGMDGLALARWIDRERPEVKVLVASGKEPRGVTERPFLPKPYSMSEVERLLRAL